MREKDIGIELERLGTVLEFVENSGIDIPADITPTREELAQGSVSIEERAKTGCL